MKTKLQVALVYSSKKRASEVKVGCRPLEAAADDDEPPDRLAEYDTEETIAAVARALAKQYKVRRMEGDDSVFAKLRRLKPDFVFNISEGFAGANRECHVPIICEMLGLPCLGSDALTLGICLDKARAKEILRANHLPTPDFWTADEYTAPDDLRACRLPAIVKPLREGSSIGVNNASVVRDFDALCAQVRRVVHAYRQPALIEDFLPGREFTVGAIGNEPDWEILPLMEINHAVLPAGANPVYGYEAKWVWDRPERPLPIHVCPAEVSATLAEQIRTIVLKALRIMRVRDWCRMDLRLDQAGRPHILELNPLPGILPNPDDHSALPAAARAAGYDYDDLILHVAETALKRCGLAG